MEMIIAILWYLQLLMPGASYSHTDITGMVRENSKAINAIERNKKCSTQIVTDFNSTADCQWKKLIEEWTDPPPQPILD